MISFGFRGSWVGVRSLCLWLAESWHLVVALSSIIVSVFHDSGDCVDYDKEVRELLSSLMPEKKKVLDTSETVPPDEASILQSMASSPPS